MIDKRRIDHYTVTCDKCGNALEEAFYWPEADEAQGTWHAFQSSRRRKGWQDKFDKKSETWTHLCYSCSDYAVRAERYDTLKNEVRDLDKEFELKMTD
jgi:hypothetical protein